MAKPKKRMLSDRVKKEDERDLLAELAIQLYDEGYRESNLNLDFQVGPNLRLRNYLREWEKFWQIRPDGLDKKLYRRILK